MPTNPTPLDAPRADRFAFSPALHRVLPCAEIRRIDERAVREGGIPSALLMENAGRGLADVFVANAALLNGGAAPRRVLICCGKGNNGGDGFVLFRRLRLLGFDCRLAVARARDACRGDALLNQRIVETALRASTRDETDRLFFLDSDAETAQTGETAATDETVETGDFARLPLGAFLARLEAEARAADWLVDALLGTGATGPLRSPFDRVVETLNDSDKPIYAVDVPSGLDADAGTVATIAVRARLTTTLAAAKPGFFKPAAKPFVGELFVADIGVEIDRFVD